MSHHQSDEYQGRSVHPEKGGFSAQYEEEVYEFPEEASGQEFSQEYEEYYEQEDPMATRPREGSHQRPSFDQAMESEGQLTIDVYQTDDDIVIKSTIAGVKPEDLDVNINNDMVTIRGERKQDEEISPDNYYYQECYWGPFSRSVILPVEIISEKAEATMKNGILTIRLPKLTPLKLEKFKCEGTNWPSRKLKQKLRTPAFSWGFIVLVLLKECYILNYRNLFREIFTF